MKNYNLVDLHFHTNQSFDAYENNNFESYNVDKLINFYNGEGQDLKLNLLCKTDHNIIGYQHYLTDKAKLLEAGIQYLPGIEVRGNQSVHWIFIFNPSDLEKEVSGEIIGNIIDNNVKDFFKYDKNIDIIEQAKEAQKRDIDIYNFIKIFHEFGIQYLAIPHLNKSGGIWEQKAKYPTLIELIIEMLNDNVISAFESKKQANFIKENILMTMDNISKIESQLLNAKDDEVQNLTLKIEKRMKHLKTVTSLNNSIQYNGCSLIYGSDFHGENKLEDYIKYKDKLFYMKAECTFEGLRLSLLDQFSRIQSINDRIRFSKVGNYLIDYSTFQVNGVEKNIAFGDGLNSIIGSRGSGKSYILNSFINNIDNYKNSKIYNQIRLKSINLINGQVIDYLKDNMFDYIGQKNSSGNDESKSFYNLLANAPFDVNRFELELEKLNFEKIENNNIDRFFDILNSYINDRFNYQNQKEIQRNFSFIKEFNEYSKTRNDEQVVFNYFTELDQAITKKIDQLNYEKNVLKKAITSIEDLIRLLEEINEFNKFNKSKMLPIEENIRYLSNMKTEYDQKFSDYRFRLENKFIKIEGKVKKIIRYMRTFIDNRTSSYQEYLRILIQTISENRILYKRIMLKNIELKKFENTFSNESIYSYNSGSSIYYVKMLRVLNINDLTEDEIDDMFKKYNLKKIDISKRDIFKSLFDIKNSLVITDLLNNRDKRYNYHEIDKININPHTYLRKDNDEFKDWNNLSPGERSRYLLDIVLENDSNKILIIDQPEDDLDNSTISEVIVNRIRELKLNRQVIVVSHNGNIVLNGDSDYITVAYVNEEFNFDSKPMESLDRFIVDYEKGQNTILEHATNILEGGKQALRMRVKRIGEDKIVVREEEKI